jgi:hypothetical protein
MRTLLFAPVEVTIACILQEWLLNFRVTTSQDYGNTCKVSGTGMLVCVAVREILSDTLSGQAADSQARDVEGNQMDIVDTRFVPTVEEMKEAAATPQPITVTAKILIRKWRMVVTGVIFISGTWLYTILIIRWLQGVDAGKYKSDYSIEVGFLIFGALLGTLIYGLWFIFRGLRFWSTFMTVDDMGIIFQTQSGNEQRLKWEDIQSWEIYDDKYDPQNSYFFQPRTEPLSLLEYYWYEPDGAFLPDKGIAGDRRIAYEKRIRLVRAFIALHLGSPK